MRWWWPGLLAAALTGGVAVADAAAQTVRLSVPSGTALTEDRGNQDIVVTARLSSRRTSSTTITLSLETPGGATSARDTDFVVASLPEITIPSGMMETTGTVVLAAVDDSSSRESKQSP